MQKFTSTWLPELNNSNNAKQESQDKSIHSFSQQINTCANGFKETDCLRIKKKKLQQASPFL